MPQGHREDCLRLELGQQITVDEAGLGGGRVPCAADEPDYFIEMVDRRDEALDDVCPLSRLAEVVLRPASDDRDSVVDVRLQTLFQRKDSRLAIDEGQVDHAERLLHLSVMVELIEDHVLDRVPFEFEDDSHPFPIALVPKIHDSLDSL